MARGDAPAPNKPESVRVTATHSSITLHHPLSSSTLTQTRPSAPPPAQELLYNTLCLGPFDSRDAARGGLLARTLRTAPRFAAFVRCFSLYTGGADPHFLDTFNLAVLAAPTVPHLVAHGPLTPASLRACLALPCLEALEVDFAHCSSSSSDPYPFPESNWGGEPERERQWDWIDAGAVPAPRLRRLLVRVYFVAYPAALAPRSRRSSSTRSSSSSCPTARGPPPSPPRSPSRGESFMDAVVRHHRALERVRCPLGAYSATLFRDLPQSVRVLEFYVDPDPDADSDGDGISWGRQWFPHARALAGLLREVGRGRRESGLREVRFLSQYRTTVPVDSGWDEGEGEGEGEGLVDAARAGGVRLVCVRVPGLYTPVRCMAEADIVGSSFGSDFCF
ncbi:hypothetical protein GSI_05725 [Ganoderma sinense ZZ0214-1]|uniref:Uncharacterized protein n=1 Tax=Ganoderma sinense ZZ0214-1 TaxID=1077348 RepID=A0A2G8SBA3_9APHY|nr:hypothetical protein GSI_05725 [Ganoderma sinense ZZ0214-1]